MTSFAKLATHAHWEVTVKSSVPQIQIDVALIVCPGAIRSQLDNRASHATRAFARMMQRQIIASRAHKERFQVRKDPQLAHHQRNALLALWRSLGYLIAPLCASPVKPKLHLPRAINANLAKSASQGIKWMTNVQLRRIVVVQFARRENFMKLVPINVKIVLLASSRQQAPQLALIARLASTRSTMVMALVMTAQPGNISLIRDNALA